MISNICIIISTIMVIILCVYLQIQIKKDIDVSNKLLQKLRDEDKK